MKIAVLSDPHLGSEKPNFVPNWERIVAHVNARDDLALAVMLGDLTLDGVLLEHDMIAAKAALAALDIPVLVLPGNHDVGDISRSGHHPTTSARLATWEKHFGPAFWSSDAIEGWRLIGINSQVIGTGLVEDEVQWTALEQALASRGDRLPMLFTHMPLFLESWEEPDRPAWALKQFDRLRLRDRLAQHEVVAVVSGHMHRVTQWRRPGEPRFIWTAASSFLTHDASMPPQPGRELLGYSVIDLDYADACATFLAVDGLVHTYIEDSGGSIYPPPPIGR